MSSLRELIPSFAYVLRGFQSTVLRAEEEFCSDLLIRESIEREARHPCLLGREVVARFVAALPCGCAGLPAAIAAELHPSEETVRRCTQLLRRDRPGEREGLALGG